MPDSLVAQEIRDQPSSWLQAGELAAHCAPFVQGERVALIGCGSSWFAARAVAAVRESCGDGETDAFSASQARLATRGYDRVLAISRSGATTEVLRALERVPAGTHTTALVGDPASPIATACDSVLALRFADDQSVVQTRFVTAVVALARGACDEDLTTVATAGEDALHSDLPLDVTQFDHHVFLGDGWTAGLADAAALFVRETAQAWTESYPALEYRHGPIAVAGERSAVWAIGDIPDDLADDVAATGATVVRRDIDPLARIIEVQRAALELAAHRGVDPDNPRHLTRAVVLDG